MMRRVAVFAACSVACATLGTTSAVDTELPSSGVGPFRKLTPAEARSAPFVFDDPAAKLREPAILRASDDPRSTEVLLYAAGEGASGAGVIYRSRATDARSFFGTSVHTGERPQQVFAATRAWEGGSVSGPSALRKDGGVWLYYAAKGGIGLARSIDGARFDAMDAPVLPLVGARAPSVVALGDGSLRMFFERADRIEEAASQDGVAWKERGVALEPSGDPKRFDADGVGDPCASIHVTAAGRAQLRVLYTGRSVGRDGSGGGSAIGFAARYEDGPLARNASPVYSTAQNEAPALFEWIDASGRPLSLLYEGEPHKSDGYPAIAAAFAPVTAALPPYQDFPASP